MKIEYVKIEKLTPYSRNTKKHPEWQVEKIARSIDEFGFNVPILVDEAREVIAGHGRVEAAKKLGLDSVPAITLDHLTEEQVQAFRIADNKIAESEWLEEDLKIELFELQEAGLDISVTGFDDAEINTLLYLDEEGKPGKTDPDKAPDPPKKPESKPGDVWICGKHRVMCGSAIKSDDMRILLMGGGC